LSAIDASCPGANGLASVADVQPGGSGMALLERLLRRGEPAPESQIHPDDQDLVTEADQRWWSTLTLKDCQAMEQEDNVFKVASLGYYMDEESMTEEDAARRVRQSFATYYAYLEERLDEPLGFGGDDAKLPYMLKDRVNRYITTLNSATVLQPADVGVSTVNALIRVLIRQGRI
jgi:hypothetical protein